MSWERYRDQYLDFLTAIHQAELTTLAAGASLKDFPRNLPPDLKSGLGETLRQVGSALISIVQSGSEIGTFRKQPRQMIKFGKKPSPAFEPMLRLWLVTFKRKKDPRNIDFQSALFRQQLVMIIAHAEAFVGDSIRAICRAEPRIINSSKKQITWSRALSFPDRGSLLDSLIEDFVQVTLQDKDIKNVLATLEKDLNLQVTIDPKFLATVHLAEQVRHLIVHTGGRVDEKFLINTRSPVRLGEQYQVGKSFVDDVALACLHLAQGLFEALSKKYFRVQDPLKATGIWIRKAPKKKRGNV